MPRELRVFLLFQRPQPLGLEHLQPAVLGLPVVDRRLGYRVPPGHSAVFAPASASFKIPMICSSVNLVRFIVRPLQGPDTNRSWSKIRGSGQVASLFFRLRPKVAKPAHQFDGGSIGHQVAL